MQRISKGIKTNEFIEARIDKYLTDIRKYTVMTPQREKVLSKIMNNNPSQIKKDEVDKEMFEGSLRFVLLVAIRYQGKNIDILDLINEGNIALLKSLETFDWTRKIRFTSYAVWWIRQSMTQFITEHSRTVRLPANKITKSRNIKNMEDEMDEILSDSPNLTFAPLEGVLLEVMADESIAPPDDTVDFDRSQLKSVIIKKMSHLKDSEKYTLIKNYGLDSEYPKSIEEIAIALDVSIEAVRQIKSRAMRKLKKSKSLRNFYYDQS